jgi:hypothetical protein
VELMQLQEVRCRPGHMQFSWESQLVVAFALHSRVSPHARVHHDPDDSGKSAILPDSPGDSRIEPVLHHRPLSKHAPWETTITLELSCVSPMKPGTPCNCLSPCCVLAVGGYSPHSSLTERVLLPSYVLLPSFVVSIALLELT